MMNFFLKAFKNLVTAREKKQLLQNLFFLSILQGLNYIFPLITLPYLVRVLGPEKYGLIAFAQALIGYFIMITDYGFTLSATREISIYRNNREKISEIFSSVITTKFLLLLLCFLILSAIIQIDKFRKDLLVYYFTFGIVIGQTLFPIWVFMGTEKMKYITILTAIDRVIFTLSIFIFIKGPMDYIYVPLLNACGYIVGGILGLIVTFSNYKIKYRVPVKKDIYNQLKEGWHSFLGVFGINLYTSSNTLILGLVAGNTAVGYYAAAEKLVNAILRMLAPIDQTIYPYVNKIASESKEQAIKFVRKVVYLTGIFSFTISLITLIGAELIVKIMLGSEYNQSIAVLRILAFLPFLSELRSILGFQIMMPFKMDSAFSRIFVGAGLFNILCSFILASFFQHIGSAITLFLTFLFVAIVIYLYLKRKGINLISGTLDAKWTTYEPQI